MGSASRASRMACTPCVSKSSARARQNEPCKRLRVPTALPPGLPLLPFGNFFRLLAMDYGHIGLPTLDATLVTPHKGLKQVTAKFQATKLHHVTHLQLHGDEHLRLP